MMDDLTLGYCVTWKTKKGTEKSYVTESEKDADEKAYSLKKSGYHHIKVNQCLFWKSDRQDV